MRGAEGEPGPLVIAVLLLVLAAGLATGCSRPSGDSASAREPAPASDSSRASSPANGPASPPGGTAGAAGDDRPLVVFLGDSLTAAFGLDEAEGFPPRVASELERRGLAVRAINAGVSGDTSAGGLERLDWLLAQGPDVVVVELGANDGLRGQPLQAIESNLAAIVERSRAAGARVVVAGMRIPTNYGPEYTAGFAAIYPRLARRPGVTLIPFLLEGVAARPELNLPDGIHPNGRGYEVVARTVADALEPVLEELRAQPAA